MTQWTFKRVGDGVTSLIRVIIIMIIMMGVEVREKVNIKLQHKVSQTTVRISENFVKCLLDERWVERFQGLVN